MRSTTHRCGSTPRKTLRTRWQPLPAEPDRLNPGAIAIPYPLAARIWRMPNDLHPAAEVLVDPGLAITRVPLIYPEMLNAREVIVSSLQEQRHGRTVLNIGRVYLRAQYEISRIDQCRRSINSPRPRLMCSGNSPA